MEIQGLENTSEISIGAEEEGEGETKRRSSTFSLLSLFLGG